MMMKDATQLTLLKLAHKGDSFFKCKQHTIHDLSGPEKQNVL